MGSALRAQTAGGPEANFPLGGICCTLHERVQELGSQNHELTSIRPDN